jgi:putative DNA primase/helicase
MVKLNLKNDTIRLIAGEKIINPAGENQDYDLAQQIVAEQINSDRQKKGALSFEDEEKRLQMTITNYYGKRDLAEQVLNIQPIYYDVNKIWWCWNGDKYKWELTDETDILNFVRKLSTFNTIKSKEKAEILEALKQQARINKPENIKPTWIQFKDLIVDIQTGEEFKATPKYFVTNPIPYELHKERFVNTPIMDKIFEEWVGKKNLPTLYEMLAYSLIPAYPIHRLFCLIGSGMNGKSCFLRLLEKFIGEDNITSTELDTLLSSRFEVTRLHKKLVCTMGETNFSEISKTSILKKLTGQDMIGFEYKNKNPFTAFNYAKIFIATNNLPSTTDKTIGFYRRWCIIDFPNQFSEKKDILKDIPEEEFEILAVKSLNILKELLERKEFTNEGTIEERTKKYEDKSNFFDSFWNEFIIEDFQSYITINDFEKQFERFCNGNRQRTLTSQKINEKMKEKGIEKGMPYIEWWENEKQIKRQVKSWMGIKWK